APWAWPGVPDAAFGLIRATGLHARVTASGAGCSPYYRRGAAPWARPRPPTAWRSRGRRSRRRPSAKTRTRGSFPTPTQATRRRSARAAPDEGGVRAGEPATRQCFACVGGASRMSPGYPPGRKHDVLRTLAPPVSGLPACQRVPGATISLGTAAGSVQTARSGQIPSDGGARNLSVGQNFFDAEGPRRRTELPPAPEREASAPGEFSPTSGQEAPRPEKFSPTPEQKAPSLDRLSSTPEQ